MIKKFFTIISLIAILLMLTSCFYPREIFLNLSEDNYLGNTMSNLYNDGFISEDESHYYLSYHYDRTQKAVYLAKYKKNPLTAPEILEKEYPRFINVKEKNIYYLNEKGYICKVNIDKGYHQVIKAINCQSLYLINEHLFYTVQKNDDYQLYVMNESNFKHQYLWDMKSKYFFVEANKIIYQDTDGNIVEINVDNGQSQVRVNYSSDIITYQVFNNKIYLVKTDYCMYKIEGELEEKILININENFNIANNSIFFYQKEENNSNFALCRSELDGNNIYNITDYAYGIDVLFKINICTDVICRLSPYPLPQFILTNYKWEI